MRAKTGDWLVVKGTRVDSPDQRGRILDVRTDDGTPPYVVRWLNDDHVSTVFPGPDALVVSADELRVADEAARTRLWASRAARRHDGATEAMSHVRPD
ncbi:DUF1918 domain-containing protein [Amycolatopsis sp. CA-230715]|uniref:DUF1918 domain-containing protein n=1 Tax=Amycolatopsis sp. CA-230715 TaxID=2745196 RepID=UPI001C0306B3|nr:DUF1918 domain-containing protein [Amycolatopsis sp. CA-230715]QWF77996.1 hypothetical protein HUW46_01389 [Amycolatopsis sp. CA-230715]